MDSFLFESIKDVLQRFSQGKINPFGAQSFLLTGSDELTLLFSAFLLIAAENNGKYKSADITFLPQKDKVLISDIEVITDLAPISPLELSNRYFIVKNADTMNNSAANKLLKTLEEPSKTCKIILLSPAADLVLPTISSRCRTIEIGFLPDETLRSIAENVFSSSPFLTKAVQIAEGSLLRMAKTAEGKYEKAENAAIDILLSCKKSSQIPLCSTFFGDDSEEISNIFDMMYMIFRDAFALQNAIQIKLLHLRSKIKELCEFYESESIKRILPLFERAKRRLKNSGNKQSITDELLFSILEVRQLCQM
jgi:DNA polymerase-3 subunit delta'